MITRLSASFSENRMVLGSWPENSRLFRSPHSLDATGKSPTESNPVDSPNAFTAGMLTDSRSFLSYPRHEYFRRILCNLIGSWVENGQYPDDRETLGMRPDLLRQELMYVSHLIQNIPHHRGI